MKATRLYVFAAIISFMFAIVLNLLEVFDVFSLIRLLGGVSEGNIMSLASWWVLMFIGTFLMLLSVLFLRYELKSFTIIFAVAAAVVYIHTISLIFIYLPL